MINAAEQRGDIKPGDTLIEATSGIPGLFWRWLLLLEGYRMVLIMPDHMSEERRAAMAAYGAELVLVTRTREWKVPVIWRQRCTHDEVRGRIGSVRQYG